jgi:hypothetical protein
LSSSPTNQNEDIFEAPSYLAQASAIEDVTRSSRAVGGTELLAYALQICRDSCTTDLGCSLQGVFKVK